jgi:hypothetical protein
MQTVFGLPALGRSSVPAETIVGVAALGAGTIGGEFIHYSSEARISLMSREIFNFQARATGPRRCRT